MSQASRKRMDFGASGTGFPWGWGGSERLPSPAAPGLLSGKGLSRGHCRAHTIFFHETASVLLQSICYLSSSRNYEESKANLERRTVWVPARRFEFAEFVCQKPDHSGIVINFEHLSCTIGYGTLNETEGKAAGMSGSGRRREFPPGCP